MINRQSLLNDLKPLLKQMEADLRARCDEVAEIDAGLKREYSEARDADRTGATFEEWRADLITQVAVAWVLSCVFVRFLEDNGLIHPPRISGRVSDQPSGDSSQRSAISHQQDGKTESLRLKADRLTADSSAGMARARDERDLYFKSHPKDTDRDYLLAVFDDLAKLPGVKDVFGPHNPVSAYRNWLSGDAAQKLIEFFQKVDTDGTGEIVHDFGDDQWDTRFLGDLYQDLSEAARKKYALLQTPVFVEEFILDRTLEPALDEFGLDGNSGQRSAISSQPGRTADSSKLKADSSKAPGFRMIDPACGSGHFLLGSFARILARWRKQEPGTPDRELVNRALAAVHGVDLNPYAVAIARFRLLVAAMRECRITKLKDAPAFAFNLVCGDSLLHGSPGSEQQVLGFHELAHAYQSEDLSELQRILKPGTYHAVVANPPYITPKDKALNQAYRERYPEVCHRLYSLSVPFMQRLFLLACKSGFTGQITANSFMKREFGKKLIEQYLPQIDLTHVIDSQLAHIPGHGIPTVIIFGRQRTPVVPTIRLGGAIKREDCEPTDPANGLVWTAILDQIDRPGSQSAYVSVVDTPRVQFAKHPWSIGGGGAAELKEMLDGAGQKLLTVIESAGFYQDTHADDVFVMPSDFICRQRLHHAFRPQARGDEVRDWMTNGQDCILFPYNERIEQWREIPRSPEWAWLFDQKVGLRNRSTFGGTYESDGRPWFDYHQFPKDRARAGMLLAFSEVTTHNHFVLSRGGKVFNRTAPVIKLPADATEDDHLALLGLLNSSTGCFWMKQVCHCKGGGGIGGGIAAESWERFYAINGTKLEQFPLPAERELLLARQLDTLARQLAAFAPDAVIRSNVPSAHILADQRRQFDATRTHMITLQEELDWQCYRLYSLLDDAPHVDNPPPIKLGQRAFEIVLARRLAVGEEETAWFARHGSTPTAEMPADWPEDYRKVVERRVELIETDPNIRLIEQPEYKRRWNVEPWDAQLERALCGWLLDRLESYFDLDGRMSDQLSAVSGQQEHKGERGAAIPTAHASLREPRLTSVAQIADIARADKDFMQVAELYAGRMDFDVANLVGELVGAESVPALPVLRYKPSGLDKRTAWERTWELQRLEDAVDAMFEVEKLSAVSGQPSGKSGQPSAVSGQLAAEVRKALAERCTLNADSLDAVVRELEQAAGYAAEAAKQNADMTNETILKPVTDAAKRAKKAAIGDIPVPPKYTSADFLSSAFWRLRGKLDVPKERWVSFPHCEGEDGTLVIAWAGYDHLQLARAIAERFELAKEQEGRKLVPLLAAIGQLIPWLKQWHNDLDPAFGTRMGDYFEGYLAEEAKALGKSVDEVMAWAPPEKVRRAGRTKKQKEE